MCQAIRFRQVKNPFTTAQQILQFLRCYYYTSTSVHAILLYQFLADKTKCNCAKIPRLSVHEKRRGTENINSFGISYLEATFLSKTSPHFLLCSACTMERRSLFSRFVFSASTNYVHTIIMRNDQESCVACKGHSLSGK